MLPGGLAVSALHAYGGIPHHTGIGKHYWILTVVGGAVIAAMAALIIRRRYNRPS